MGCGVCEADGNGSVSTSISTPPYCCFFFLPSPCRSSSWPEGRNQEPRALYTTELPWHCLLVHKVDVRSTCRAWVMHGKISRCIKSGVTVHMMWQPHLECVFHITTEKWHFYTQIIALFYLLELEKYLLLRESLWIPTNTGTTNKATTHSLNAFPSSACPALWSVHILRVEGVQVQPMPQWTSAHISVFPVGPTWQLAPLHRKEECNEALLGSAFMTPSVFLTEQLLSKIPKRKLDHLTPPLSI